MKKNKTNKRYIAQNRKAYRPLRNEDNRMVPLYPNMPIISTLRDTLAPNARIWCPWIKNGVLATGAASFNYQEFYANGADDPQGAGGSTQPSNYVRFMSLYALYRVLSVKVRLEITSRELDQEMAVGLVFNDLQPSTVLTSYDRITDALENNTLAKSTTIGTANGSAAKATIGGRRAWYMTMGKVVGNEGVTEYDLTFSAAYGSVPNQLIWLTLVVQNLEDGVTIPNGISYRLHIDYDILFTSLRPDNEVFFLPTRRAPGNVRVAPLPVRREGSR